MASARLRHSTLILVCVSRLPVYRMTRWGIERSLRPLGRDLHGGDRAADRKDWNRRVVLYVAASARRRRNADEGTDLEAALAGFPIGVEVGVRQQGLLVVSRPALQ